MAIKIPSLFGGVTRTRILMSLFVDGPKTLRALARNVDTAHPFVYKHLRALERKCLVRRDGERPLYAFNWSFAVATEIAAVLYAFASRTAPPRVEMVAAAELPKDWRSIFGAPSRAETLLALHAIGPSTLLELAETAGLTRDAVRTATQSLKRGGVVRIELIKNRRVVSLDDNQRAFDKIQALLTALTRLTGKSHEAAPEADKTLLS